MYLSRVELDEGKINTMRALLEPQKLHGAIEQAFPGERQRRLWRLDRLKGTLYLLHQNKWLLDRAEKHGFALDPAAFTVTASGWLHFSKGDKNRISLLSATYEGVLQVTDADLFRQTLTRGIGRGKAYGQGLLTVLPRRDGR